MHHTFLGRRYKRVYVPTLGRRADGAVYLGDCDPPDAEKKEIRISLSATAGDPCSDMEAHIHEYLHSCAWHWASEEWVSDAARDIARALVRDGFGRVAKHKEA